MRNKPVMVFTFICVVACAGLAGYLYHAGSRTPVASAPPLDGGPK